MFFNFDNELQNINILFIEDQENSDKVGSSE